MKKPYDKPELEILKFDYTDVVIASNPVPIAQFTKTPAWLNCTILPSGDPITHYTPAAYKRGYTNEEP